MKRNHRELRVWQFAMVLVERIYALTATFPKDEVYGLTSQMRRAAVSIPSNIAEGAARGTTKELLHFLRIADSSLSELDTQLELAKRLRYIADTNEIIESMNQLSQSLAALKSSLNRRITKTMNKEKETEYRALVQNSYKKVRVIYDVPKMQLAFAD